MRMSSSKLGNPTNVVCKAQCTARTPPNPCPRKARRINDNAYNASRACTSNVHDRNRRRACCVWKRYSMARCTGATSVRSGGGYAATSNRQTRACSAMSESRTGTVGVCGQVHGGTMAAIGSWWARVGLLFSPAGSAARRGLLSMGSVDGLVGATEGGQCGIDWIGLVWFGKGSANCGFVLLVMMMIVLLLMMELSRMVRGRDRGVGIAVDRCSCRQQALVSSGFSIRRQDFDRSGSAVSQLWLMSLSDASNVNMRLSMMISAIKPIKTRHLQ